MFPPCRSSLEMEGQRQGNQSPAFSGLLQPDSKAESSMQTLPQQIGAGPPKTGEASGDSGEAWRVRGIGSWGGDVSAKHPAAEGGHGVWASHMTVQVKAATSAFAGLQCHVRDSDLCSTAHHHCAKKPRVLQTPPHLLQPAVWVEKVKILSSRSGDLSLQFCGADRLEERHNRGTSDDQVTQAHKQALWSTLCCGLL